MNTKVFIFAVKTPQTTSLLFKSRVIFARKRVKSSFTLLLVSFRILLCFINWCLVSRRKNLGIKVFGHLTLPGRRSQVLKSLAMIVISFFSAILTILAWASSSGSSSTPKMRKISLHPYCLMLSVSMIGYRSSTLEVFILCCSSTAQKLQKKGLAKKILGMSVST